MPPRTYSLASLLPWLLILFAIAFFTTPTARNWLMSEEAREEQRKAHEREERLKNRPRASAAELDRRYEKRQERYRQNRAAREAEERARNAALEDGLVEAVDPVLPAEAPPERDVVTSATAEVDPTTVAAERQLLRRAITPIFRDQMPRDLLQVMIFYDGDKSDTRVEIELDEGAPFLVNDIEPFRETINVREFDLRGSEPTGRITIRGIKPNGVVDGVAVGLLWLASDGEYHKLQTHREKPSKRPLWVCGWPLGLDPAKYRTKLSERPGDPWDNVEIALCGAELVKDGTHQLQ